MIEGYNVHIGGRSTLNPLHGLYEASVYPLKTSCESNIVDVTSKIQE